MRTRCSEVAGADVRGKCASERMAFAVASLFLLVGAFELVLCAGSPPVQPTAAIPPGTVLPVRLDDAFETALAHAEQHFEARIAQEVPLPGKQKISLRSRLMGTVVSVSKDSSAGTVSVSLKFDQLEEKKEILHIATSLRALASYQAARSAQMPLTGADAGTPPGWGTTVQIGGDQRFGNGGKVRNRQKQTVGKGVIGGVLVHLAANASLGCDGPEAGNDRPQALWVFSADACGVYDLKNVKIAKNGKSDPAGVITLEFAKDDMKLESGTAFLLLTMRQP